MVEKPNTVSSQMQGEPQTQSVSYAAFSRLTQKSVLGMRVRLTTKRERVGNATVGVSNSDQVVIGQVSTGGELARKVVTVVATSVVGSLMRQSLLVVKAVAVALVVVAVAVLDNGAVGVSGDGRGHLMTVTVGDFRHVCDV